MRHYPEDEDDKKSLVALNVEPWMVEMLRCNPEYVSWGNHEDYMIAKDAGWREPVELATFADIWEQDELNELVNGYFFLHREAERCAACDSSGYNPATKRLSDDWYDFAETGRRWCDNIEAEEVEALVKAGRLRDFLPAPYLFDEKANTWKRLDGQWPDAKWVEISDPPVMPDPAVINSAQHPHDAINSWICIEVRGKRLGIYGKCESCAGDGYVHTEPSGHLRLQLWYLHPRKGASRGVIVKDVTEKDIPKIEEYFRQALDRTRQRFNGMAGL